MKKYSKLLTVIFTGLALSIGVAVSGGIIRNSYVDKEVRAASGSYVINFWNPSNLSDTATTDLITTAHVNTYSTPDITSVTSVTRAYQKRKGGIGLGTSSTPASAFTLNLPTAATSAAVYCANWSDGETPTLAVGGSAAQDVTIQNSTVTAATVIDNLTPLSFNFSSTMSLSFAGASKRLVIYQIVLNPVTKSLTGISVTTPPTKTAYFVGESFNPNGMVVTASYDAGDPEAVSGYTCSPSGALTIDDTQVVIQFTFSGITKSATQDITVSNRTLLSISVNTNPTRMSYYVGESFNPGGMKVTAHFNAGDDDLDYKDYSSSPSGPLNNIGSQTITISANSNSSISDTITINVSLTPPISDLFFSEYIEGSSSNKALEIYNGTGATVDLSIYSVKLFANGSSSPQSPILSLTGNLITGEVFVIVNSSANATIKAALDIEHAVTFFGGDDAIGLFKNDVLIDVIGKIGEDPGTAWTGAAANNVPGSTENMTLVRTASLLGPKTTFNMKEWNAYPSDTSSYLGSHTTLSNDQLFAVAYGVNFLNATSAGCAAESGAQLSEVWSGLETSYNALSPEAKAYLTSLTPNEGGNDAEHAVARYVYIVGKYSLNNYMSLVIHSSSPNNNFETINVTQIITVAIVSAFGFAVLLSYLYLNKKKSS